MAKEERRARPRSKATAKTGTTKARTTAHQKKSASTRTAGRSAATGKFTDTRTAGFRGFGGGGTIPVRPKPPKPLYSAPATPARPERVRGDRPAAPTTRIDQRAETDAADDSTLERYLDPEFYAAASDPAWIGKLAASDATIRMNLARHGVPAQAVAALADALDMSRDEVTRELGLPRSTVERKLRDGGHLGQAESERILGVVRLIGQVRRIVEESGDPTGFDAPLWVATWLRTPVPALGGRPPMQYMDTAEGRAVVAQLVEQMQSGSYA